MHRRRRHVLVSPFMILFAIFHDLYLVPVSVVGDS